MEHVARTDSARTTEPPPASAPRTKKKRRRPKLAVVPPPAPTPAPARNPMRELSAINSHLHVAVAAVLANGGQDAGFLSEHAIALGDLADRMSEAMTELANRIVDGGLDEFTALPRRASAVDVAPGRPCYFTAGTLRAVAELIFREDAPKDDPRNAASLLVIEVADALEHHGHVPGYAEALTERLRHATDVVATHHRRCVGQLRKADR